MPLPSPMPAARPRLSLVMPALNEEENLEEAVSRAAGPLTEAVGPGWEIVLVNDGSTDGTEAVAEALAAADPRVRAVHHAQNEGLGGALRSGFAAAQGDVLAYCDSDLPFDMRVLAEAYTLLGRSGADVVSGYRLGRDGEGWRRHLYSAVYNRLVRLAFGLRVRDVNFSLKVFRRAVWEREGLHSTGSFIDAELLARAHRNGFRIAQLGVVYTPRVRGTSTLSRPSVIVGILRDLVRYRRGRLGPVPLPRLRAPRASAVVPGVGAAVPSPGVAAP